MEGFQRSYSMHSLEVGNLINHPIILGIGWENHYSNQSDDTPYVWNCQNDDENVCIFQYTVSGRGMLQIGEKMYPQLENSAFLIERPGPYKYWLPDDSDHWEIKFLTFNMSSIEFCDAITRSFGRIFTIAPDAEVFKIFDSILNLVENEQMKSIFDNSLLAYTFIIKLHQHLKVSGPIMTTDNSIQRCLSYINKNFNQNINLVKIADAGKISPFYLNKKFKEIIGETPIQYLIKTRIKKSASLLIDTNMRIEEIAVQCGFENANYFAKVFKKYTGLSPSQYRRRQPSLLL